MKNAFMSNIKAIREDHGLKQFELAEKLNVSRQTVVSWENGKIAKPRQPEVVDAICKLFNVSEQDLYGYSDGYYAKKMGIAGNSAEPGNTFTATAPVVGQIAAGDPHAAIEMSGEFHDLPQKVRDRFPDGFFLIVRGDSMNKILPDGCYAYIAPYNEVEMHSGDIAAVKVNGDEATVKRIKLFDDVIILEPQSTNPDHKRRIIDKSDPDAPYVRMLGKVVWYDYEFIKF